MGLCSHLNDISSDSIPILVLAIVANCVGYLRSLLLGFLQSVGFSRLNTVDEVAGDGHFGPVGSGLAGLIVLAEQLNVNRVFSYSEHGEEETAGAGVGGCGNGGFDFVDCVVCLCRFTNGEQVTRLGCRHLFHKACLDGWFDQFNWNCPLCRFPFVSEDPVAATDCRR
ncbi:E3 ubiquitin-protein ligase RHA2A-like [Macadamia integrifolia]|uniref:E3 ubiquitin-protein ligase RHA2A-like n=1 Tax=Macadamia integrifolia TaxID=60698 RepID=UPI001C4FF071|nr:E3 ubiquitin-protein ligase RHA2A-like [Macadamia integrifolia]